LILYGDKLSDDGLEDPDADGTRTLIPNPYRMRGKQYQGLNNV
jgi:hypothetical protein